MADDKLDKKIEKEIKKDVEKEVKEEVEDRLGKKLDGKLGKELKHEMEREVKKRLHVRIYEGTKSSALAFKKEFQSQVVIAVGAALGFLIALSWRTPIQNAVDKMIVKMGLGGEAVYLEFLSALVITLIAVLILMWVSKWKSGGE